MTSLAKNLVLSCVLVTTIGASAVYTFSNFGPTGTARRPLAPEAESATAAGNLPPIHETYAGLRDEIVEIVARQEREVNPFNTDYFAPPPPPPPSPPPPPPPPPPSPPPPPPPPPPVTTREVVLRYQGFFETTEGDRRAYLRKEERVVLLAAEASVVDDWKVAEILPAELVLKRADGEELRLEFNKDRKLEVNIEQKK